MLSIGFVLHTFITLHFEHYYTIIDSLRLRIMVGRLLIIIKMILSVLNPFEMNLSSFFVFMCLPIEIN